MQATSKSRTGKSPVRGRTTDGRARAQPSKSARATPGNGAGRTPKPVPGRGLSLRSRRVLTAVGGLLIGVLVIVLVSLNSAFPTAPAATGDPATAELASAQESMRSIGAQTDSTNLTTLSESMVKVQTALLPVMSGLQGPMPTTDVSASPATVDQLLSWHQTVNSERDRIAGLPSGSSEYNIARNGFALAVELLDSTLRAYPVDVELAVDLRRQTVDAWSLASTQLDLMYQTAQRGHLHINLPLLPSGDDAPNTSSTH